MYNLCYSSPRITNCTFSGNSALNGNACACDSPSQDYPSNVEMINCIVWDGGKEIWNNDGSIITISYTDLQGGQTACFDPCNAIEWGLGNIDTDPCFADPCNNDYHLKSEGWRWDAQRKVWTWDDVTSRCIDAGNPGSPLGDELLSIPVDPNNIWGQNLRINMGAFGGTAEASMPPYDWAILGDLTNDGLVNLTDFAYQAADWLNSADQQPGDLNRDSLIDISDIALLVEDWLEQTTWHE
jgi:hypothetical protein